MIDLLIHLTSSVDMVLCSWFPLYRNLTVETVDLTGRNVIITGGELTALPRPEPHVANLLNSKRRHRSRVGSAAGRVRRERHARLSQRREG